jgi:hypothetical protein
MFGSVIHQNQFVLVPHRRFVRHAWLRVAAGGKNRSMAAAGNRFIVGMGHDKTDSRRIDPHPTVRQGISETARPPSRVARSPLMLGHPRIVTIILDSS